MCEQEGVGMNIIEARAYVFGYLQEPGNRYTDLGIALQMMSDTLSQQDDQLSWAFKKINELEDKLKITKEL